jgi:ribosomal protein S14
MLKESKKQENKLQTLKSIKKNGWTQVICHIIKVISRKIKTPAIRQYIFIVSDLWNHKYKILRQSPSRIRKICILTGRSRSIYRFFRVSRLKMREYGQSGYFVGLKKASW